MNIKELVKNKKLKFTQAREKILEIFVKSSQPLAYEDVKQELQMDKTTFYRNMTIFEKEGIVSGFESSDKKKYYELVDKLHAHFICNKCHSVNCLDSNFFFSLPGHSIDNIIVHGKCKNCLTQSDSE